MRIRHRLALLVAVVGFCHTPEVFSADEERALHRFERQQLTDVYYSEGANAGDINRDGKPDVVYGPYWYEGPDFKTKHEIYPAKPQNREGYADNFFSWVYDFNGDGWNDVFDVGFPGTPAYVYENPPTRRLRQALAEAPGLRLGLATNRRSSSTSSATNSRNWSARTTELRLCHDRPEAAVRAVDVPSASADRKAPKPFGHGLGVGDVNGDGRLDIITKDGWFEQPDESLEAIRVDVSSGRVHRARRRGNVRLRRRRRRRQRRHHQPARPRLRPGLVRADCKRAIARVFRQHLIMGKNPAENRYGVLFSELHSVQLADMDGDGLKDIVTGKTYWSHHTQSPMWDAGAVVYWFKLSRGKDGVDWIPYQADGEAGIGRQIIIVDVNGDKLPDIVVGGMKGAHVLTHIATKLTEEVSRAAQPKPRREMADGLKPEEAAEHMTVPARLPRAARAGEPQVHQPVAFAIDPRGRLWVAEAYTYPNSRPGRKRLGQDRHSGRHRRRRDFRQPQGLHRRAESGQRHGTRLRRRVGRRRTVSDVHSGPQRRRQAGRRAADSARRLRLSGHARDAERFHLGTGRLALWLPRRVHAFASRQTGDARRPAHSGQRRHLALSPAAA